MNKRVTISVNDELDKEVQRMKKKQYFNKSYSEVYRILITRGIEYTKKLKEREKYPQ